MDKPTNTSMYSAYAPSGGRGSSNSQRPIDRSNDETAQASEIIAELIEKTKVLAEELKNSNRIATDLMEENNTLRTQYTTLKHKFLTFLSEQQQEQSSPNQPHPSNNNNNNDQIIRQFQRENSQLLADNQQLKAELSYATTRIASLEKRNSSTSALLQDIDSNKDREITNLLDQIALLKEQLRAQDPPLQQHYLLPHSSATPVASTSKYDHNNNSSNPHYLNRSNGSFVSNMTATPINHDKFYRTGSTSNLEDINKLKYSQQQQQQQRTTAAYPVHQSLVPTLSTLGIPKELRASPTRTTHSAISHNQETLTIPIEFKLDQSLNSNTNAKIKQSLQQIQQQMQPQSTQPQLQRQPSQTSYYTRNFDTDILYSENNAGYDDGHSRNTPKRSTNEIFPDSSERLYRNTPKSRSSSTATPLGDIVLRNSEIENQNIEQANKNTLQRDSNRFTASQRGPTSNPNNHNQSKEFNSKPITKVKASTSIDAAAAKSQQAKNSIMQKNISQKTLTPISSNTLARWK